MGRTIIVLDAQLLRYNGTAMNDAASSGQYSFTLVDLNGQELWIPPETLRTMTHCTHDNGGRLFVNVERAHFEWMRARVEPGTHFIDVGASTGAICLPLAKEFGSAISITAFEPARPARAILEATVARNGLAITILPMACSDHVGRAKFYEFPNDDEGKYPWLPESSTLADTEWPGTVETSVELTTLDVQFSSLSPVSRAVIKIDVEGHEAKVLGGALEFLARAPFAGGRYPCRGQRHD